MGTEESRSGRHDYRRVWHLNVLCIVWTSFAISAKLDKHTLMYGVDASANNGISPGVLREPVTANELGGSRHENACRSVAHA